MSREHLISEEIAEAMDLLEQIEDVNRMIKVHHDDEDDFMLSQYKYRKKEFLKKLSMLLVKFEINPSDLAA